MDSQENEHHAAMYDVLLILLILLVVVMRCIYIYEALLIFTFTHTFRQMLRGVW